MATTSPSCADYVTSGHSKSIPSWRRSSTRRLTSTTTALLLYTYTACCLCICPDNDYRSPILLLRPYMRYSAILWLSETRLILLQDALVYESGSAITSSGALSAYSGAKTGRSPSDKRIVEEPSSKDNVWWGPVNKPMSPEVRFSHLATSERSAMPRPLGEPQCTMQRAISRGRTRGRAVDVTCIAEPSPADPQLLGHSRRRHLALLQTLFTCL